MKGNDFEIFLNNVNIHFGFLPSWVIEKSVTVFLAKTSFAFLLISMFSYWFQAMFKNNLNQNAVHPLDNQNVQTIETQMKSITPLKSVSVSNIDRFASFSSLKAKDSNNKTFLEKVPLLAMWSANITLAFMLSIRWVESGHFPLSNLYESLLFLSWSLTSIHLILENLFNKENQVVPVLTLGAITSPLSLFTNAFATFSLPQDMQKVTVLVPALQSNWLIMHVSVMIVSYAALLSGSLLSMAFLVINFFEKNDTTLRGSMSSKETDFGLSTSNVLKIQTTSAKMNSLASNTEELAKMNGSGMQAVVATPTFAQQTILDFQEELESTTVASSPASAQSKADLLQSSPETTCASSVHLHPLDVVKYPVKTALQKKQEWQLFPWKTGTGKQGVLNAISASLQANSIGTSPFNNISFFQKIKNRPKQYKGLLQTLDNLSYRSIGFGFALLTIGILSGAVWANEAWGSYWSWDPKETWAFVTWLVFALYLHTRLSKGWVGKESALVATFGFAVIWFCYLGVNLFGKGLHSYGWVR